jgi:hypothetical protein
LNFGQKNSVLAAMPNVAFIHKLAQMDRNHNDFENKKQNVKLTKMVWKN